MFDSRIHEINSGYVPTTFFRRSQRKTTWPKQPFSQERVTRSVCAGGPTCAEPFSQATERAIDFMSDCARQSGQMRQFSALVGASAMLFALFSAPFFHFHDSDHDGRPASLVHSHAWAPEVHEDHADTEWESGHSEHRARSVDFFTFSEPSPEFELAVGFAETGFVSPLIETERVTLSAAPRAHGPPGARPSVPRSPPTV